MSDATDVPAAGSRENVVAFGPFLLLGTQRLLLEGDNQIRLGSRALDILSVLVEQAGRAVAKEETIARVWPQVFVDESNLKIQVSALRRALGDGQGGHRYIVTVPGRGYEFVAPVTRMDEPPAAPPPAVPTARAHNLPAAVFFYSRNRAGEHPARHLACYAGILQADAYAGFGELYDGRRKPGPITEAACWSHPWTAPRAQDKM